MADEASTLIAKLLERGAQLQRDGERLGVRAVPGSIEPELRQALSVHKSALLSLLSGIEALTPLGDAQQQIWFAEQLNPQTRAHDIEVRARLRGAINRTALTDALATVVARHASLRAHVMLLDGRPALAIRTAGNWQLSAADTLQTPFNLYAGPLLRAWLLPSSDTTAELVLRAHHLIFDGTSVRLLLGELSAFYNAAVRAEPAPPARDDPFRGVLLDEARVQRSAEFDARLASYLAQLPPTPHADLPEDPPDDGSKPSSSEPLRLPLGRALAGGIRALAQAECTTPFALVATALSLLMSRHSGSAVVTLAVPVSGRNSAQRATLIGMLVDTALLPVQIDMADSFRETVRRTAERVIELHTYRDVPLHRIMRALGEPERHPARRNGPLKPADVMLNYIALPPPHLELDGVVCDVREHMAGSRFGITVYAYEQAGEITLKAAYDETRFLRARIREWLEQLRAVLSQACDGPDRPCAQLSLHTASSPKPPQTQRPQPARSPSIVDTLWARGTSMAERTAVVESGRACRYAELYALSSGVAQALLDAELSAGSRIALLAPRSTALVAGMLGVWRAGCSLMVLDPDHPIKYLNAQLASVAPCALLCLTAPDPALDLPLNEMGAAIPIIMIGRCAKPPAARHSDEAYVAFTSGTSLAPRAISAGHAPLDHFFTWYQRTFCITPEDRFTMLSGLGHDPILRDIIAPLQTGAAIVIPPAPPARLGSQITPWLLKERITVMHLTPSLARMVLLSAHTHSIATIDSLRLALFGGEPLNGSIARQFASLAPNAQLVNFYGTTETPQAVSWRRLDAQDFVATTVSIGSGIDDVCVQVLDPTNKPAGLGEIGQIHVRSKYLSRGYLNDQQATTRHFLSAELYRTGDLGRLRLDGTVDFVGRADRQLKIRGERVQPAAVEAALLAHPSVRAAAVVAQPDDGGSELVAHLEAAPDLDQVNLRRELAERLPPAMRPTRVVIHSSLPVTTRGKIDFRALIGERAAAKTPPIVARTIGSPAASRHGQAGSILPLVRQLWCEALGCDRVAADDNFFALGGHSLSAAMLAARLHDQLAIEVPLRWLFDAPTLVGFSTLLGAAQPRADAMVPLPPGASALASFAQRRLWYLDQLANDAPPYHIEQRTRIEGPLDLDALARALCGLERDHEVLRSFFIERDGDVQLGLRSPRDRVLAYISADEVASEPFRLDEGPLWQARLRREAADRYELTLRLHHAIGDGWSMRLLNQQLRQLYHAAVQGREQRIAIPALRYIDVAHWQRARMTAEFVSCERAYWSNQLAGLERLPLPSLHEAPVRRSWQGSEQTLSLTGEPVEQLWRLAAEHAATPFMVLHAALVALLTRYCDTTDIAVGTPYSQRPSTAAEQLVGLFLNVVVLRTRSSEDPSFIELLKRCREVALQAWAHAELPFEQVVAATAAASGTRQPLFRVFLNVMDGPANELTLPGVQCTPAASKPPPARVDLTLYAITSSRNISIKLVYARDLFDAFQMKQLRDALEQLLRQVATAPNTALSQLPLGPPPGHPPRPPSASLPSIQGDLYAHLSSVAQQHGERSALLASDGPTTSYTALWRRAATLATNLAQQLPAGAHVGLLVAKDASLLVGVLACLIAGLPFVPLTADMPPGRMIAVAQDAELAGLLCAPTLTDLGVQVCGKRCRLLAWHDDSQAAPADNGAPRTIDDRTLAYILYTSGSTGRPKGVMQSRAGLLTHALNYAAKLALTPDDRLSLVSTFAFDAAFMDIFGAYVSGATLCPLWPEELPALWHTLKRRRITVFHATPTVYRHLLTTVEPDQDLDDVRWVVLGGEEVRLADVAAFNRHFHANCQLINGLGPTECTLALQWQHRAGAHMPAGQVPVGRPVPGITVSLQAASGPQVACYGVGEIVLSGRQVALGYFHRAADSARAFTDLGDGVRSYRSGDLGSWLPDGSIAFVGRNDDQLKVRGYRVEPGEVIDRLRAHPAVREAALLQLDRAQAARLVAHVATELGPVGDPQPPALQRWCAAVLPPWMVPDAIVVHQTLPKTASGKLDRRALSQIPPTSPSQTPNERPLRPIERQLIELWSDLLGNEHVGIHDDFFELGGHSLLALTLLAQLRSRFGAELSLPVFLDRPTIVAVASALEGSVVTGSDRRTATLVQLRSGAGPRLLLVTPPGARARLYRQLAERWRGRVVVIEAPGVGSRGPAPSIESLAERCLLALTEADESLSGGVLAGFSHGGVIAFELAHQLAARSLLTPSLALFDSFAPASLRHSTPSAAARLNTFALALIGRPLPAQAAAEPLAWLVSTAQREGQLGSHTRLADVEMMFRHFDRHADRVRQAICAYRPEPLRGRVALFRASTSRAARPTGDPSERAPAARRLADDWVKLAPALQRYDVPGDHYAAISAREAHRVLRGLEEVLTQSASSWENDGRSHLQDNGASPPK